MRARRLLCALLSLGMLGWMPPHHPRSQAGSFELRTGFGPLISGTRVTVQANGAQAPFALSVLGPGTVEGHDYIAPVVSKATTAMLIGSTRGAVALATVQIVPPPAPGRAVLAVATYDSGIALHDAHTFELLGYAAIGGPAADVTFTKSGDIVAADTDGDMLTYIKREPWSVQRIKGVPEGNEIAVDATSGNIFVSDRDAGPTGALTRITPGGQITLVPTGNTAEGLTIDEGRQLVYVGNVNEPTVAVIDARTMQVVRKLPSVERTFGIALDAKSQRLFVVSNASPGMNNHGGYVAVIDAGSPDPRILARSGYFTFPLGVALDARRGRLFVTDEAKDRVYVLNAKTLTPLRAPIATCGTPWRPAIAGDRLFIPCAHDDRVDVVDLVTLHRVRGAPFATGGFPLGVASWP